MSKTEKSWIGLMKEVSQDLQKKAKIIIGTLWEATTKLKAQLILQELLIISLGLNMLNQKLNTKWLNLNPWKCWSPELVLPEKLLWRKEFKSQPQQKASNYNPKALNAPINSPTNLSAYCGIINIHIS